MNEKKLCIDCKWFVDYPGHVKECRNPEFVDMVTGVPTDDYAAGNRAYTARCGINAVQWKPKDRESTTRDIYSRIGKLDHRVNDLEVNSKKKWYQK